MNSSESMYVSGRIDLPTSPVECATMFRNVAVVGVGLTETGRIVGPTAQDFAAGAIRLAADDAGIEIDEIDGLIVSNGVSGGVDLGLVTRLNLGHLATYSEVLGSGATAISQLWAASALVASGAARTVACVHADAPITPEAGRLARMYEPAQGRSPRPEDVNPGRAVTFSPVVGYALGMRRHMNRYGTQSSNLGAIAVAERLWAGLNPAARYREPIGITEHQASRWVAEPLHLLDCCHISNGGCAFLVTSRERAAHLRRRPVYVWGIAGSHAGPDMSAGPDFGLITPAANSGPRAMSMARIRTCEVDLCQLYDSFTYNVLVTLEDYGFCQKGEGGEFVSSGALAPGGSLPINTGGGQLSGFYLWGMTQLYEGIVQAQGLAQERQVLPNDVILVSGSSGVFADHITCVLSPIPMTHVRVL